MTHLVLLGAGHAHLFVLQRLLSTLQNTPDICKVTLISPQRWQFYSGMIPGWIEGIYSLDQCRINIKNLLKGSDIHFVELDAIGIDPDAQTIQLSDASSVHYDLLSIDIGSGVRSIPAPDSAHSAYPFHHYWQ
jgi:NADH dehydrogenase FAD-containing subunit